MTVVDVISILVAIGALLAMFWGAYTLFFTMKQAKNAGNQSNLLDENVGDKNGVPILPRHQRPEYSEFQAETDEAEQYDEHNTKVLSAENTTLAQSENVQTEQVKTPHSDTMQMSENNLSTTSTTNDGEDAFRALANATETITPTVQTFDERKLKKEGFSDNSPILDNHIQAQVDNDQNSPLNNAVQNLNITLFPNEQMSRIAGRDLLKLFDKYGLKFGAMNMFHRYDNKDGTGMLWFSVMMVTEDGILPFDLNKLPMQYVKGLVMFVALPHPEANRGFDSMMSVAGLLAQDLQASLYDETGNPLSKEAVNEMREIAINFGK